MKIKNLLYALPALMLLSSCSDFLDRPAVDNYNTNNFYKTDEQCEQGVNYLYNSPWYDFQRGFFKTGEVMSGNYYWGGSPYMSFSTNGTDQDLINMSYSLWAVNGHANTVIKNILDAEGPSDRGRYKSIAEALTWKAMAYFFMVRTFGEVPIVHDGSALIADGGYNSIPKVTRANVYEYIIMTLEKAIELFDKYDVKTTSGWKDYERIDYYSAEALLAKVYLTRAGLSGSLDASDLAKAAQYAKDVIDNSGRTLTPSYEDIFRLVGFNQTGENLISWLWSAGRDPWTQQNTFESDLAMVGFSDQGDCWGGWGGPSVDLMEAFGTSALENPDSRDNSDVRRKATGMMAGDTYSYFWQDKGGFDFLRFIYDADYGKGGPGGAMQCPTGANSVKHLYGNNFDHELALNLSPLNMAYQLPTHLLRLSDVYLIYAEAVLNTNNADALKYVNLVRERAGAAPLQSVSFEDVWKERRLELACEGDRWYDYVRRSYYDMDACIAELKAQKRSYWDNLDPVYKAYYEDGSWDASEVVYNTQYDNPNVTASSFTLPFPTMDVVFNGKMATNAPAEEIDVRATYSYDF
ncbi:MAG: RagB/SusD family nutrient uptake outer membrane protein [Bacteroidales bacterium]|nr:RagB/SusD family nutrient uptake outer membrane protein [Bacteroidales bacterium]